MDSLGRKVAFAVPPGCPALARLAAVLSTPFFFLPSVGLPIQKLMTNINLSTPDPRHQQSSGINLPPGWSRERLERLPFEQHSEAGSTYMACKLSGRYWIPQNHFKAVWVLFWCNVGDLDPARKHTTVALCNDPTWYDRPRGQRIALGRCIKYLAAKGVLPITLANPGKTGPRKYFLNADLAAAAFTH